MSTVRTESYEPLRRQNVALQHLAASREEIVLLSHLFQASLVVERKNPLREAVIAHRDVVRNMTVTIVIMLSAIGGALAPQIALALGIY